ncbi:MAG: trimethylamine methyltransferase family protein [Chloroflexi bacterium]|nr:trimethylamine methyltransferase family protein [Chloroflexota bacterium]
MGTARGLIRLLDQDEMGLLHQGALRILEEVGMAIPHAAAQEYLGGAGCRVDRAAQRVRFPAGVVQGALDRMRQDFTLEGRLGGPVPMRYTTNYFTTIPQRLHHDFTANAGGFPPFILDLEGRRRPATLEDVRDAIRLADALENVDLIGLPCSAQDVPGQLRPIEMTAELVKLTSKPGGIEAWTPRDVAYITEMAVVIRGSEAELRQRPFLIGYGEARSPLCVDPNMTDVFIEYVKRGLPQTLDTMPCAGTSAPVTAAGALVVGLAETLSGLVLGYAIDPHAMVALDICPGLMDPRTLLFPYSGADRIPLIAAATQLLSEYYHRPGGCHGGKTDACVPGAQAGIEKALSVIFPILCGATGIGTLGHVENAVTFSPVQLVIDDLIVGYIKRMLRGFEVTPETLALDVIAEVGPGGSYLEHEHTVRNLRRDIWVSDLLERMPWATWDAQEVKGLEEKARSRARRILREHSPAPLDDAQVREIDRIVAAARRELASVSPTPHCRLPLDRDSASLAPEG